MACHMFYSVEMLWGGRRSDYLYINTIQAEGSAEK